MKECCNLKTKLFSKKKAIALTPIFVILLCIFLYAIFVKPTIEMHTWELFSAQQAEPPNFTVAHHYNYTFASDGDDTLFKFSKPIELTCVAEIGKLTITDKTNNIIYSGTYEVESWNKFSRQRYKIVIDGKEGKANISDRFNRTLFMSIDGYYLNFVIK